MDTWINALEANLDAQIKDCRVLLDELHAEQTAVISFRADRVERAADRKEKAVDHLQQLERQRLTIIESLSGIMALPSDCMRLAEIIERVPDAYQPGLRARRQQLLELTCTIQRLNRQNQDVYEHSLGFVRHALGFLSQNQATPAYQADGSMRDAQSGGRVVSSDV